jgi:acyl carrier protein
MYDQLKSILADTFGCTPDEIPDDADLTTVPRWDSLHHLELMLALEAEFDIKIPTEAIIELVSLQKIEDYVRKHAAGVGN